MNRMLHLLIALLFTQFTYSQLSLTEPIRCYTVEYNQHLKGLNPSIASVQDFEKTMSAQIKAAKSDPTNNGLLKGVLKIPVIVHVVHFGESVGTGPNIAAAQVYSQIEVMNEDFRRTAGTLGFNNDARGADTEIEFVPALVDPQGNLLPEPGIRRYHGPLPGYVFTEVDLLIKPNTIWDPNRYLNMWTVNFQVLLLGYAQFPDPAHGLATGLSCNSGEANTDGVVMGYNAFGSRAKYPQGTYHNNYDLGRTVTHEIGHWLGLRHIWGDGGCEVDDYCGDTPNSSSSTGGCPTNKATCGSLDMIQNYMDYSYDRCMNILTNDQTLRMRTVLTKSTRRRELLSSTVHLAPVALDAAIIDIISPSGQGCNRTVNPEVLLRNLGQSTLTSVTINYHLENGPVRTFSWQGSLKTAEITAVTLPSIQAKDGNQAITAYTSQPNGAADNRTFNDKWTSNFVVSRTGEKLNFNESFESGLYPPSNKWKIENPDRCVSWSPISNITGADGQLTSATFLDFYEYNARGKQDALVVPLVNLGNTVNVVLEFNVASSQTDNSNDRLEVFVSTDCGSTYEKVYDKAGAALATAPEASDAFYPTSSQHWRRESISLNQFRSSQVTIKFVATNDYGDNLFIDDIYIGSGSAITRSNDPATSISEAGLKMSRVYPNPSNGIFEIDFQSKTEGRVQAKLVNSSGAISYLQQVIARQGSNHLKISASGLSKGVYFLFLESADGSIMKEKIIIR